MTPLLPVAWISIEVLQAKLLKLAASVVSTASLTAVAGVAIVFGLEILCLGFRRSSVYRLLRPTATARADLFFFVGRITGVLGLLITLASLGTINAAPRIAERLVGWHVLVRIENPVLHVLAFIVVYDLVSYWVHRGRHQVGWWWELHKVHHAAEEFNAITTARGHPLDFAAIGIASAIPAAIFGGSIERFLLVSLVLGVHAGLTHSMLDWSWGWFGRYVVFSPIGHRIHHSMVPEHFNRNYGAILPIWDHLFGTYYGGPVVNQTVGVSDNPYNRAGLWSDLLLGTQLALQVAVRSLRPGRVARAAEPGSGGFMDATRRGWVWVVLAVAMAGGGLACGLPGAEADAVGTVEEAGSEAGPAPLDVGHGVDPPGQPDAPVDVASRVDVADLVDAGEPLDASEPADAGEPVDAGQPVDVSGPVDGGPSPTFAPARPQAIQEENLLPGDPDWRLVQGALGGALEAYADRIQARTGEVVSVKVSSAAPTLVRAEVFRLGYYGGAGARRLDVAGLAAPLPVGPQPRCGLLASTGRVECSWATTFSFTVEPGWLSGYYLVRLTDSATHDQWQVPFVVEDDRRAEIVAMAATTTWQAYNFYGGESLYQDDTGTFPSGRAHEVSYDRPFIDDFGSGRALRETPLAYLLESRGLDVTYTAAQSVHQGVAWGPGDLRRGRLLVAMGHSEYWSVAMREAFEAALARGSSAIFAGANAAYWRVRLAPGSSGQPDRVVVCYKSDQGMDPLVQAGGTDVTARFRDAPMARPENGLVGIMYGSYLVGHYPMVVSSPLHWSLVGTGLEPGQLMPLWIGDEADRRFDNGSEPPGLEVIGEGSFVDSEQQVLRAQMTVYPTPSGGLVYASGSIDFSALLGDGTRRDARAERIVENVVARALGLPPPTSPVAAPPAPTWELTAGTATLSTVGRGLEGANGLAVGPRGEIYVALSSRHQVAQLVDGVPQVIAGDGLDGKLDGPGAQARFRVPLGLVVAPDGTIYVADSDNHTVRAIAPDAARTVSTVAGVPSPSGAFRDGPGATARFNRPVDLLLLADGSLLVTDSINGRIRHIGADAARSTTTYAFAGAGYADGPSSEALIYIPVGLARDPVSGALYVIDAASRTVRRVDTDTARTVTTLAGSQQTSGDGAPASAGFLPQGGLVFRQGAGGPELIVADTGNGRLRRITLAANGSARQVSTLAGSGGQGARDGAAGQADLALPLAMRAAPGGSLLVLDGQGALRRLIP